MSDALGRGVSGARVTLSHQGESLQEGVTASTGAFSLEIEFGDSGSLDLVAAHPEHDANQVAVRIADFEPTEERYIVVLMPSSLSPCAGVPGAIVVGSFLPPLSAPDADLAGRVQRVLSYRVLPRLQAEELRHQLDSQHHGLVPEFLRCEGAAPRSESQGIRMARALGGQGMIWGSIADADTGFDIEASVADTGGIFDPPFTTTSHAVDLEHPSEAAISPMARAALLVGVMDNLERAGQCQGAIYVSNVVRDLVPEASAEASWQMLESAAEGIRGRCQRALPHIGLLEDGS